MALRELAKVFYHDMGCESQSSDFEPIIINFLVNYKTAGVQMAESKLLVLFRLLDFTYLLRVSKLTILKHLTKSLFRVLALYLQQVICILVFLMRLVLYGDWGGSLDFKE